jgi:hypothetical protein
VSHHVVNDWTAESGSATHDAECDAAMIIPPPTFRDLDVQAPDADIPDAGLRYTLKHAGPDAPSGRIARVGFWWCQGPR